MLTPDALKDVIARRQAPGVAAVLFEGERIVWSGAEGMRHVDGGPDDRLLVTTKARVASVSKVATALTLLKLAEEGRIDLDRDCSDIIGFRLRHPRYPDAPITPRMALSHTAGVRDGDGYRGFVTAELAGFFTPGGPDWDNGARWASEDPPLGYFAYANIGMGIVAQLTERVSGQRFDQYATRHIFGPLGIGCGFNWSGVTSDDQAAGATLYRYTGDGPWTEQVDGNLASRPGISFATTPGVGLDAYRVGTNGLVFSPQGGLRASVMDLAAIGMALTGAKPLLADETRRMLAEPQWRRSADGSNGDSVGGVFRAFGTGVHVLEPEADGAIRGQRRPLIGHYGDAYGLLAGLWVDPVSRAGFAWFLTGSPTVPAKGESGIYAVEEQVMRAAAADLGLA